MQTVRNHFFFTCLLLFTNSAIAQNLCDASCNLTISFPDGGSITADEPLTFSFGDAGLVDTVATTTAYANGNTLELGAGETLAFGAGGSFDLGASGNLAYTSVSIATTGTITLEATGGAGTITILNMHIETGALVVNSDASIENSLYLSGSESLTIEGAGTITVTGSLTLGNGQVITGATLTTIELSDANAGIVDAEINLAPVTDLTGSNLEGLQLLAKDGNSCTVSGEQCIAGNGVVYVFNDDGELVPVDDSGSQDTLSLLLMIMLLAGLRRPVCFKAHT